MITYLMNTALSFLKGYAFYFIIAIVALTAFGYYTHSVKEQGRLEERLVWQKKMKDKEDELRMIAARQLEEANAQIVANRDEASKLKGKLKDLENATKKNTSVCIPAVDVDRLRALRPKNDHR